MIIISTVQTLTWHTFPHKYKYTPTNSAEDDLFMREGDIDKHIQNSRYLIGGIAQVTFWLEHCELWLPAAGIDAIVKRGVPAFGAKSFAAPRPLAPSLVRRPGLCSQVLTQTWQVPLSTFY